jgi:hypothetical protein
MRSVKPSGQFSNGDGGRMAQRKQRAGAGHRYYVDRHDDLGDFPSAGSSAFVHKVVDIKGEAGVLSQKVDTQQVRCKNIGECSVFAHELSPPNGCFYFCAHHHDAPRGTLALSKCTVGHIVTDECKNSGDSRNNLGTSRSTASIYRPSRGSGPASLTKQPATAAIRFIPASAEQRKSATSFLPPSNNAISTAPSSARSAVDEKKVSGRSFTGLCLRCSAYGVASCMDHSGIPKLLHGKSKDSFDRALTKSSVLYLAGSQRLSGHTKQPSISRQLHTRASASRLAGCPASMSLLASCSLRSLLPSQHGVDAYAGASLLRQRRRHGDAENRIRGPWQGDRRDVRSIDQRCVLARCATIIAQRQHYAAKCGR